MVGLQKDWSQVVINIHREIGRLMDDVSTRKPPAVRFSPRVWTPAIDVYETDSEVVVLVELPGAKEDEVEVVVHDNRLSITGERKDVKQGVRRTYAQMEILWGPFQREIDLPTTVDTGRAEAFYDRGFLEVVLPKLTQKKYTIRI